MKMKKLVKYCDEQYLILNTGKTKEMLIDFRKSHNVIQPLVIQNEQVETVWQYKYLGTIIDDKLSWKPNCHTRC